MRASLAVAVAVACLLPALSGCVSLLASPKAAFIVNIPDLKFGDVIQERQYSVDPTAVDPGFIDTIRVAKGTESVPDRFGFPTDALHVTYQWSSVKQPDAVLNHGDRWIETGGGNWLVEKGVHWDGGATCYWNDGLASSGSFSYRMKADTLFQHDASESHSLGQIWGKSFASGQTLLEKGTLQTSYSRQDVEITYEGQEKVEIQSPAFPDEGLVPVLVVKQTIRSLTTYDPRSAPEEHVQRYQLFLAEGVPAPLRVQTALDPAEGHPGRLIRELVHYEVGTVRVPFGDRVVTNQFGPAYPGAVRRTIATAPPLGTLAFEFPIDAALNAVWTSPRAASFAAWSLQHPEAYIAWATYVRDAGARVYTWTLLFEADSGVMGVTVQREYPGSGLPPLDLAESMTGAYLAPQGPSPHDARARPMVDAATALTVATAFNPDVAQWTRFSWSIGPLSGMLVNGNRDWALRYTFENGHRVVQQGPVPFEERSVQYFDPAPVVDGQSGGLRSDVLYPVMCSAATTVRPPV